MERLPDGWVRATLGEICSKPQYGWTTSAARTGQGPKLVRTSDISRNLDWESVPFCKETPPEIEKFRLESGDILISRAGSVGLSCVLEGDVPEAVFASYLIRFRPLGAALGRYIGLFLRSAEYWSAISEDAAGIAVPNINASKLAALELPLPPLAEQKRIVEKVEALLAQVQAARDRLDRVQQILKRFRQAVLAAAFSDPALQEAEEHPLSELTAKIGSGATPRGGSRAYATSGVPFIRSMNVRFEGFATDGLAYLTSSQAEALNNVRTELGDVLLNITGASIGRACLLPTEIAGARVSQHVAIVRPIRERLLAEFLHLFLCSPGIQSRINSEEYGVTRQALTKAWLTELRVPAPPLPVQELVVAKVTRLLAMLESLSARVARGALAGSSIGQAVLKRAFEGSLVLTEAELAEAEGRGYESGEELLERVTSSGGGAATPPHRTGATRKPAPVSGRRTRR